MLPELSLVIIKGVKEGRMDIVVTRPGGVPRDLSDIATCDARSARAGNCAAAFAQAEQDKLNRYKKAAWPFAVEHRGRLGGRALELIDILAGEAALVSGCRPSTLARKWKRQLQLVTAFEVAEVMRSQLCGLADEGKATAGYAANSQVRKHKSSSTGGSGPHFQAQQQQPPRQVGYSACALHQPLPCFGSPSVSSGSGVASR